MTKVTFRIPLFLVIIISAIVSIAALSVFTTLINGTQDLFFVKHAVVLLMILPAAYFLISMIKYSYGEVSFNIIGNYLVAVVFVQMILALIMFLNAGVREYLISIQKILELESSAFDSVQGFRILGFGANFFTAGIINAFSLVLLGMLLSQKNTVAKTFLYVTAFWTILVIGSMMSRTTIIGGVLGLVCFLFATKLAYGKIQKTVMRVAGSLLLTILFCITILRLLPENTKGNLDSATQFGFELFINYFETGTLRTDSTDDLKGAYVFPTEFKTYLIGDGYYADPLYPETAYYMGTDVGYLRFLFYFGIIGLMVYMIVQLFPIYWGYKKNDPRFHAFFVTLAILYFLLNLKGGSDIFFGTILFCFVSCPNKTIHCKDSKM